MATNASTSSPPALSFESVSFGYGRDHVVHSLTGMVAAGEMVGLLGPNGAGKSTLLRLAAGALRPQTGTIHLYGDNIQRLPRREVARRVAVAPQDFGVQFAYTVRQIVELGRMPHHDLFGVPRQEDAHATEAAMSAAGVEHLADRVFNDLSGGERQRVLIALTLAQESPILLLDEPTAHLDIRYQIEVLDLLRQLNAERKLTVLAALHDLNLAARYFPRLILFRQTILADGPPTLVLDAKLLSEVYETPVRVGILRGEQHLSVLPPSQGETIVWQVARRTKGAPTAVHVVAGGGSGELMMRALADGDVAFSAGPLNVGDSDHSLAERLASHCIVEPPYAPVSVEGLAAARARMREGGAVIVCPTPLGPGNIGLLEAVLAAREMGCNVVLLEPAAGTGRDDQTVLNGVAGRDYSGRGIEVYGNLLAAGCSVASSPADALRLLG